MGKKLIIASLIGVAALGALYYYREDVSNLIGYTKEKDDIMSFASKKIKKSPVNIKIQNINEL